MSAFQIVVLTICLLTIAGGVFGIPLERRAGRLGTTWPWIGNSISLGIVGAAIQSQSMLGAGVSKVFEIIGIVSVGTCSVAMFWVVLRGRK